MHGIFHKIIYRSALGLGLLLVAAANANQLWAALQDRDRQLAGPLVRTQLEVKYELATKRLLSYKDVSNLLSNN